MEILSAVDRDGCYYNSDSVRVPADLDADSEKAETESKKKINNLGATNRGSIVVCKGVISYEGLFARKISSTCFSDRFAIFAISEIGYPAVFILTINSDFPFWIPF